MGDWDVVDENIPNTVFAKKTRQNAKIRENSGDLCKSTRKYAKFRLKSVKRQNVAFFRNSSHFFA